MSAIILIKYTLLIEVALAILGLVKLWCEAVEELGDHLRAGCEDPKCPCRGNLDV